MENNDFIILVPEITFSNALTFEHELQKYSPSCSVVFDFSRMSTFEPFAMLMMGAIMRNFKDKYPFTKFTVRGIQEDGKGKHYAGTMGFYKYLSESLNVGKAPGEAIGSGNYIPITSISVDEIIQTAHNRGEYLEIGELLEHESARLAQVLDRGNRELHNLLVYLIREILRNTPEHAKTDKMWICGQCWPNKRRAEIAIIDEGIGIFNSLIKNSAHKSYIKDNKTALQWALKAGISDAFRPSSKQKSDDYWSNSGYGLYMVSEICKSLHGSFTLASYGNYILVEQSNVEIGDTFFKGTAIRLSISLDNIMDTNHLLQCILQKGEQEASTIRNAFKKASTPSRGLMSDLNIR